ncbi:hypothetical protein CC117_32400 [Parafrankia colletiae]|uniref:HTH OST-type domain-containing protein n=1 Tax=Parafrankia colletiae TaxID=573497 RepID=A0A1S1RBY9_9ACTN|nr:OST-HTH/LOTUS domain-containing protein [Parafrankia colletiae]MCK9904981.1 OST-HTH/LOTUS domain-containing protein [Frankia sp. Cpl3]OHV44303.1 hypothetical protein CC117_32400 [Parafrankia colletiae]
MSIRLPYMIFVRMYGWLVLTPSRLREAVATNCGPGGWTHLSAVGLAIRKHPAVVLKAYGYARLMDLMVATDLFELQQNGPGTSGPVHARIK